MLCPVDKKVMKEIRAYDMALDVCPVCMGVWFDKDELGKMTEKISFGFIDEALRGARESAREQKEHFWQEDSIECPRDYIKMLKRDFAGDSKIHIDYCDMCNGFWIDGDEVKRLEDYMKPDRLQDLLAQAYLDGFKEREEMEKQVRYFSERLKSLPSVLVSIVRNPILLVLFCIKILVDVGMAYLEEGGS